MDPSFEESDFVSSQDYSPQQQYLGRLGLHKRIDAWAGGEEGKRGGSLGCVALVMARSYLKRLPEKRKPSSPGSFLSTGGGKAFTSASLSTLDSSFAASPRHHHHHPRPAKNLLTSP